jgi:MtN3 and saliva related transmembrane protein
MLSPLRLTETIGYFAACCTTLSFVPQLVKIRKQGGDGLSYSMLLIYLLGLTMWLIYGVLLHAMAIIAANAVTGGLVAAAIVMKATAKGGTAVEATGSLDFLQSPQEDEA